MTYYSYYSWNKYSWSNDYWGNHYTSNKAWIKGRLTIDQDCDNTENAAGGGFDAGLGGQLIKLVNKYGSVVATTTTDANGNYQFDVSCGYYKVVFPEVDGYNFAQKDVGHSSTDSDANSNGATDFFYIGRGQTQSNVDASIKPESGSVSGNVFCDVDCDGVRDVATAGTTIVMEAEHMYKYGFKSFYGDQASGGKAVKLCNTGDLVKKFGGADGTYNASIFVQDENDGQSVVMVKVNGQVVKTIKLDADSDGGGSNNGGFTQISIGDLDLKQGDKIGVWAQRDGYEFVRIDKLEFTQAGSGTDEPGKAGVTVQLLNAVGTIVATTTTDANGDYQFDGVAPGAGYKVQFVAPDGQVFTQQDVGSNDSIDSDVNAGGMSDTFTVSGGENVTIDAGLKDAQPGSLSGRYFMDNNDNDQDDAEPGIQGVLAMLLDSSGNPATDIDGNPVASILTAADGSYSFGNLAAGDYTVKFTDPNGALDGKRLIDPDVGPDGTDSDAIGDTNQSVIVNITVVEGQNTPDNDAGAEVIPNTPPTALDDDAGKVCEDDTVKIDVLGNDSDSDGGTLAITSVAGQAISEGGSVVLANGVSVMLMGGQLQIDGTGSAEVQALVPDQEIDVTFEYGISDGQGGTATANVDVTFCGEYENLAELGATLPTGQVMYTITDENVPAPTSDEAYTLTFMGTGDARFDGVTFDAAYCLDLFLDDGSPQVTLKGDLSLIDDSTFGDTMGIAGDQVDNLLNYILNTDYAAQGYTDAEVQGAVWSLFNGFAFVADGGGDSANSDLILDDAKANGVNFEVAPGQDAAVLITPEDASFQPFFVGIEYTDCLC